MAKLIVTRDVTPEECLWLSETVVKGTIVYQFDGCLYGCIGYTGVPVSDYGPYAYPFYELPATAVEDYNEVVDTVDYSDAKLWPIVLLAVLCGVVLLGILAGLTALA